jgi:hypothetical protein
MAIKNQNNMIGEEQMPYRPVIALCHATSNSLKLYVSMAIVDNHKMNDIRLNSLNPSITDRHPNLAK